MGAPSGGKPGHCRECEVKLTIANQYPQDRAARRRICRQCKIIASRRWETANPERRRANSWRAKLREYGLTPEEYETLLKEQGGVCLLCDRTQQGERTQKLFVDHDHETGRVRGLLCRRCNTMLGWLEEVSPRRVMRHLRTSPRKNEKP